MHNVHIPCMTFFNKNGPTSHLLTNRHKNLHKSHPRVRHNSLGVERLEDPVRIRQGLRRALRAPVAVHGLCVHVMLKVKLIYQAHQPRVNRVPSRTTECYRFKTKEGKNFEWKWDRSMLRPVSFGFV